MQTTHQDHETFMHESYHVHNCKILGTTDIVKATFHDNTLTARFKRWWFDLFLVSKFDETARILFHSSHGLRMERIRQFRKFRGKIHPLCKFRNFWDIFMLIVFVLHLLVFQLDTSGIYADYTPFTYYLDVVLEMFIILDVIVNMRTAYINKETRKVVFETKLVLIDYFSTKVFFHVASAIPLQCIMFLRYGKDFQCALCKLNNFIMTLKIINILHLARTYEYSACMARDRKSFTLPYFVRLVRIAMLCFLTILVFRDMSDSIHLIVVSQLNDVEANSRPIMMLLAKFAYDRPFPFHSFFSHDISRLCMSFCLYTFHVPGALYVENVTTTLLIFIISNAFFMWMLLEIYSHTAIMKYPEDAVIRTEQMALALVKCRHLPDHVAQRIREYFDFNLAKIKVFDTKNRHYNSMPWVLRKEAFNSCYSEYLQRIPYFAGWPITLIRELVMLLVEEIYLKNSLVAEPWVEADGLFIVAHGELAVYTNDQETGHLIDGDYFGELSLVTDQEMRISTVISVTPCLLLMLNKTLFRKKMRKYPNLFFEMKDELKKKFVQQVF